LPARGIVLWTEGASATKGGPGSGLPELPQPADPQLPELPQPADPRLPELPQPADPRLPELPQPAEPPRIAVSRSRAPEFVQALADRIGARLTPIGSAGMKAMSVLLGEADAYVHRGRMKEWDSAAPAAVAKAAGLHVSRLDGSPLTYNTPERLTPDLLICLPSLAQQLLDAVDALLDLEH
jgi:hypothetical protein